MERKRERIRVLDSRAALCILAANATQPHQSSRAGRDDCPGLGLFLEPSPVSVAHRVGRTRPPIWIRAVHSGNHGRQNDLRKRTSGFHGIVGLRGEGSGIGFAPIKNKITSKIRSKNTRERCGHDAHGPNSRENGVASRGAFL